MGEFINDSLGNSKNEHRINRGSNPGELRIIASIVDDKKVIIGYVIMVEKTGKIKPYTLGQTAALLQTFGFINALLDNGEIIILDSSKERLPKFNKMMRLITSGISYIIIRNELVENKKLSKYRVVVITDEGLNPVDMAESQLILLASRDNYKLVNAKCVKHGNKMIVSAIRGQFGMVDLDAEKKLKEKRKAIKETNDGAYSGLSPEEKYRRSHHLKTIQNFAAYFWAQTLYYKNNGNANKLSKITWQVTPNKIKPEKELEILLEEDLALRPNLKSQVEVLRKLIVNNKVPFIVRASAIFQYYYEPKRIKLEDISKASIKYAELLKELGVATPNTLDIIEKVRSGQGAESWGFVTREEREARKPKEFEQFTFRTAKDIAQLGFAITKENGGLSFKTDSNSIYKLKFIGEYVPNYAMYKHRCNSFGDLMSLAVIDKSYQDILKYKYDGDDYYDDCILSGKDSKLREYTARIEIALCMLAFYNYDLAKDFYYGYIKTHYDIMDKTRGIGIDFDKFVDLSEDLKNCTDLKLYYSSGYNVVINNSKYSDNFSRIRASWKVPYLRDSMIVNVRRALKITERAYIDRDIESNITSIITTNALKSMAVDIEAVFGVVRRF